MLKSNTIVIFSKPIWLDFSDSVTISFDSCNEYKQDPPLNHKLSYWSIQLTADWLLEDT